MERNFTWEEEQQEHSGLALAAFVLGIIACSLNLLIITSPFGLISGILALVFGAATRRQGRGFAGLVLALCSFFILLTWAATLIIISRKDPFL